MFDSRLDAYNNYSEGDGYLRHNGYKSSSGILCRTVEFVVERSVGIHLVKLSAYRPASRLHSTLCAPPGSSLVSSSEAPANPPPHYLQDPVLLSNPLSAPDQAPPLHESLHFAYRSVCATASRCRVASRSRFPSEVADKCNCNARQTLSAFHPRLVNPPSYTSYLGNISKHAFGTPYRLIPAV